MNSTPKGPRGKDGNRKPLRVSPATTSVSVAISHARRSARRSLNRRRTEHNLTRTVVNNARRINGDWIPDDEAINDCTYNQNEVYLEPGYPGYILTDRIRIREWTTVFAGVGGKAKLFRSPNPLPGGELLLTRAAALVSPVSVQLTGPRVAATHSLDPVAHSIPGLPQGSYNLVPLYAGGIAGSPQPVTVTDAATTIHQIEPTSVGAATFTAHPDLCRQTTSFRIVTKSTDPAGRRIVYANDKPSCEMAVAGLEPGRYNAQLQIAAQGVREIEFHVRPQDVVAVRLTDFPVKVQGRVTTGTQGVAGAALTFLRIDGAPLGATASVAETDATGGYAAGLNQSGDFLVRLKRAGLFEEKRQKYSGGLNIYDWVLQEGSVSVDLRNSPSRVVELLLTGGGRSRSMRWKQGDGPNVVFDGLPFGAYELRIDLPGSGVGPFQKSVTIHSSQRRILAVLDPIGLR